MGKRRKKPTEEPKHLKIHDIFQEMTYVGEEEDVSDAMQWLKSKHNTFRSTGIPADIRDRECLTINSIHSDEILCRVYVPKDTTVEEFLKEKGRSEENKWLEIPSSERAEIMQKLAAQIQLHESLIIQLEVVLRGILSKDTKKTSMHLLTEYLQFYSSFNTRYVSETEDGSIKPSGAVVAIISDKNALWCLGYVLGSALAWGSPIILQTGPQLTPITTLLINLAVQVGIPEGTINVLPGELNPGLFFEHIDDAVVIIFDDLYKKKYLEVYNYGAKFLNCYSQGIPMLVFENCDLDSACHSVVDAVWGHKGILPWSVRTILIQESIFETFVKQLKRILAEVKVGYSKHKLVDISCPDATDMGKLTDLIKRAKKEGVEVYQPRTDSPIPAFMIEGNTFPNNVIKGDTIDGPIVTLSAFRTVSEGVALANNTRQGLAASVWTESTGLAHEVIKKLNVSNVWINSHGLFSADISFSPYKSSGNGYFGGSNGLYQYSYWDVFSEVHVLPKPSTSELMDKLIYEIKKAQETWSKYTRLQRAKYLQTVAVSITAKRGSWENIPEEWLDEWIAAIYDYFTLNKPEYGVSLEQNFNVVSIKEPRGIVAIEASELVVVHNKTLIIASLVEGNAVMLLNDAPDAIEFYRSMSSILPNKVLTVLPFTQEMIYIAALHKELNCYFAERPYNFPCLKNSIKFRAIDFDNWEDAYRNVTLTKNAWFNVGDSFA